jgi:hypothetical protein
MLDQLVSGGLTYSGQHDFVVAEDDKLLVASQEILYIVLHCLQFCLKKETLFSVKKYGTF